MTREQTLEDYYDEIRSEWEFHEMNKQTYRLHARNKITGEVVEANLPMWQALRQDRPVGNCLVPCDNGEFVDPIVGGNLGQ